MVRRYLNDDTDFLLSVLIKLPNSLSIVIGKCLGYQFEFSGRGRAMIHEKLIMKNSTLVIRYDLLSNLEVMK